MKAIKNRTLAIGAVLIMCMTVFVGLNISSDDSDATNTVYIQAGETKRFTWSELGISGSYDGYRTTTNIQSVYSTNSYYNRYVTLSSKDSSGINISLGEDARAGTYTIEWEGYYDWDDGELYSLGTTTIVVTNNNDGSSSSKPLNSINWNQMTAQNAGSYDVTVYVKRGASVSIYNNSCSYRPTISLTQGAGLSYTCDSTYYSVQLSGNITSDADFTIVYGNYNWTVRMRVVDTYYTHTIAYAGNGNTGGSTANTAVTDTNNGYTNLTLAANGFTRTGYTFTGWLVNGTLYQPGQIVSVGANASVTATAQWSQNTLSASANNMSGVSGQSYSNQIGASANNGGSLSYAVKSCTGGNATVNSSGLVTYTAPTVNSTTSYTVTVTVTASFPQGGTLSQDVSFSVSVDPVLSFTNAATNGTLSVKGA